MEDDSATQDGSLKELLDQEYYLTKVLEHLLDYGLHECRRVCRKWYEVCNQMSVKLRRIPVEKIPAVANKFPNAVRVVAGLENYDGEVARNDKVAAGIESLRQLRSLESLKLCLQWDKHCERDALNLCDSLEETLQSMQQLRSLCITGGNNVHAFMHIHSVLRYLTGLTQLCWCSYPIGPDSKIPSGQLCCEPFTEIRDIEHLCIQSLSLQNGQLVFPSLTHLTYLCIIYQTAIARNFKGGVLQMILPYASSLRSLTIHASDECVSVRTEWALLREFSQLSSVEFKRLHFDECQDACAALSALNLTHLGFEYCRLSAGFVEELAIGPLTSLRSFRFDSFNTLIYKAISAMPHLTSLRLLDLHVVESLTVLSELRVLRFHGGKISPLRLSAVLSCMPNLESLHMRKDYKYSPSMPDLPQLKKLTSLTLFGFAISDDFWTLSALSGLSELRVDRCSFPAQSTLSGINSLTNLKKLELIDIWPISLYPISALNEGKLSGLRYLTISKGLGRTPSMLRHFMARDKYKYFKELNPDVFDVYKGLSSLRQCLSPFDCTTSNRSSMCCHVFEAQSIDY